MLAPASIKPSYQSAAKFAIFKLDSPIQPTVLDSGPAHCYTTNSSSNRGIGSYRQVEAIASSCFAQIIAE